MPTFVYPSLLWGLLIAAVPVLIHLINMMRHRRVRWAAMDFLLASQKKNRFWVLLRQLLLLLLRMGIVAVVVAALAQPLWRGDLAGLLGRSKTHHIVLLDDSFSMSDCWADTSAMAEAKDAIQAVAAAAARASQQQTFTLLRFSRCGVTAAATRPDILEERVDTQFDRRMADMLASVEASQTAVGPMRAFEALERLSSESDGERRVVYLVSDFRRRDWLEADDIRAKLKGLASQGVELRLINCVQAGRPNLAVRDLRAVGGTRAAGVPLFMEVTVENYGDQPVHDVTLMLEENGHGRPAVKIPKVPPRKTATQRFEIQFASAGEHRITARLGDDAVAADNSRFAVIDLPEQVRVLIVDGGAEGRDGWFLAAALAPGGAVRTGIAPQLESPRFLSNNSLEEFDAVYLVNPGHLAAASIETLEKYVAAGGGLAVFLGDQTRSMIVNESFYRQGKGFFPVPLARPAELAPDHLGQKPDLEVEERPPFDIFKGDRNSFLSMVNIWRYFRTLDGWKLPVDSGTTVIARLRNGAPLAIESRFGRGRVITLLTTASPTWNNWARGNPSFVVVVQELQSLIARRHEEGRSRNWRVANGETLSVGQPIHLTLNADEYDPTVRFFPPIDASKSETRDRDAAKAISTGMAVSASPKADGTRQATLAETDRNGIYEVELARTAGGVDVLPLAVNVDADEGDLQVMTAGELAVRLEGIDHKLLQAADLRLDESEHAGQNLGDLLLCLAVLMLLAEQILAYTASYHPPMRRPAFVDMAAKVIDVSRGGESQ